MTGVRHTLPDVVEAAALGAAAVAVDGDLLRQVPGKHRRWFKGTAPYLAITVDHASVDDDALVFVEVCVRGRFARRSRDGAVETGHTDELELSPGGMPRARLEQIDDERPDVLTVAKALLEGAGLILESAFLTDKA
mgnify:CR=1 FL=1